VLVEGPDSSRQKSITPRYSNACVPRHSEAPAVVHCSESRGPARQDVCPSEPAEMASPLWFGATAAGPLSAERPAFSCVGPEGAQRLRGHVSFNVRVGRRRSVRDPRASVQYAWRFSPECEGPAPLVCGFRSTRAPGPAGLEQPFRRTRALSERSDEGLGSAGVRGDGFL
jgi:hypothetical protein